MNALELLTQQHHELEELFSRVEAAEGEDRADLFAELADAFMLHSHLEEEIFYPAAYDDRTDEELREAVEEHLQAKRLIADILEEDVSSDQWMAKCTVLHEDIQHHVEEEEGKLFPMVEETMGDEALDELGSRMEERADELVSEGQLRDLVFDETSEPVLPT